MKQTLQERLLFLNKTIAKISALELKASLDQVKLIDIREESEWLDGKIPTAETVPRGFLELRIENIAPKRDQAIVLYCAGGTRSVLAAQSLIEMGYTQVRSLDDGIKGWKDQGQALEALPRIDLSYQQRYSAQMRLPQVGLEGQKKLSAAKVLIVGAGGLGSPAAFYLAAAGVGTIGIIDDDVVDLSNLQRQILHTTDRVGLSKVDSAQMTLKNLNPNLQINAYKMRLTDKNIDQILPEYDVIVDGCDNFDTRFLVNDACLKHKKVNVHGSIFWFEGQATVFCAKDGPCYRCLHPERPTADMAPNCAEAGVLGVLPGIIGLIEATEVIKLILGLGVSLVGRLLLYDSLQMEFRELNVRKNKDCVACGNPENIKYQKASTACEVKA
ncbi:MAG: molybdopterin-synthase adenylyltransferase MoeB [Bdellovibrio sp.]|nr:molybdopterin-synthase adenylyltransferase MoeB [Bdellovibrio sp.]